MTYLESLAEILTEDGCNGDVFGYCSHSCPRNWFRNAPSVCDGTESEIDHAKCYRCWTSEKTD